MDALAMIELGKVSKEVDEINKKLDMLVEPATCVWKSCPDAKREIYASPHIGAGRTYNFSKNRFKFCPFCGKQIKTEEYA